MTPCTRSDRKEVRRQNGQGRPGNLAMTKEPAGERGEASPGQLFTKNRKKSKEKVPTPRKCLLQFFFPTGSTLFTDRRGQFRRAESEGKGKKSRAYGGLS